MSVQLAREPSRQQAGAVDVVPMSIHIGAEIRGVDLSRPLPPEHVSAIRARCCAGRWSSSAISRSIIAGTSRRAPVRRNDRRTRRLRQRRRVPADLFRGQGPQGEPLPGPDPVPPVVGLAHRHHRCDQSACRVDPARRYRAALRRRHPVHQPGRGLQRAVAGDADIRRRLARRASLRAAARRGRDAGVSGADAQAHAGERAPDRESASGNRRARALREPVVPEVDRRRVAAREPGAARVPVGAHRAARVHGALPLGAGQRRVLG